MEEKDASKVRGGIARASSLSEEKRKEIAKHAAEQRWSVSLPKATHAGEIKIGDTIIACAVLESRKRVLTQETFLKAIGRAGKAKGGKGSTMLVDGIPPFLAADNLKPFISDELFQSTTPIIFRSVSGVRGFGYDAMLLPMVCEVYLRARDARAILPSQGHIVEACDLLMRGLARVGIIALVDEATGYQHERANDELIKILEAYVQEELRPWVRTFPPEFFRQMYRLQGWEYRPGTSRRTPYVGKLINKYVYAELPPGVLAGLRRLNPVTERGYRKHKHFQFLTADTGNEHLDRQITAVVTLLKISDTKGEFEANFEKAFKKDQMRLPLVIDVTGKNVRP
jgi:hypothetical protein